MDVFEAMATRRSLRGFLPTAIPRDTIEAILTAAARAPSGSNIQPWKVRVTQGAEKARLSAALRAAHDAGAKVPREYHYYPRQWREPYLARRRKVGWGLYALAGVARGDEAAGHAQRARNFDFFGAPVGLFFTLDRDLEQGSWLDMGMFLQNVMLAARGHGLDSCAQAASATTTTSSARISRSPTRKRWSAACRSATPTHTSRPTGWRRSASHSRPSLPSAPRHDTDLTKLRPAARRAERANARRGKCREAKGRGCGPRHAKGVPPARRV